MISLYIVKINNKLQNWFKIQRPFKNMLLLDGKVRLLKNQQKLIISVACSEASQTSKIELFAEIVEGLKAVSYFRKKP